MCSTHQAGGQYHCVAAILESPPAAPVLMVAPASWFEQDGSAFLACQNPPPPVSLCRSTLNPDHDPGPDALTLKEVNGTLTFVAGSKIRLGPVDPAAIAARPPSPTGCRTIVDAYHALIASPAACGTNADCVASIGLPIPGDPSVCGVDVAASSWATLSRWLNEWPSSCATAYPSCTSSLQPAVCRNGVCAPACPGVSLPYCPYTCPASIFAGATCEQGELACQNSPTTGCSCPKGVWTCGPTPPVSAECPLTCALGGGALVDGGVVYPPLPDAGTADASGGAAHRFDASAD
jgi:hypothetical protein